MQGKKAKELLTSIGNRELQLTHEAFDALPYSTAVEHIRAILVDNRLMVIPVDPYLRRFEQWLATRLQQLADTPNIASTIEQFATWHHLKRLRKNVDDSSRDMDISTRTAKQQITEAGKFLLWLHEQHGLAPAEMTQWHIDLYLNWGRPRARSFAISSAGSPAVAAASESSMSRPATDSPNRLSATPNTCS